jgi:hypothetical protein
MPRCPERFGNRRSAPSLFTSYAFRKQRAMTHTYPNIIATTLNTINTSMGANGTASPSRNCAFLGFCFAKIAWQLAIETHKKGRFFEEIW